MAGGFEPWVAGYLAVVVLVSAFVRGFSGFGYPVLVIAAGALVTNPLLLIPVAVLGDLVLCIQHAPAARPHVVWPVVRRLVAGLVLGLIPGLWVLGLVSEDAARIGIGVMVLATSVVMMTGWTLPGRAGPSATLGMGLVSGLVAPAGVAGPPAVMLVAGLGLPPLAFRATLLAYFIILDVLTFGQFALAGWVDARVLWMTLASVPLVIVGSAIGAPLVLRADPVRFRKVTIGVLMLMAGLGLVRVWL